MSFAIRLATDLIAVDAGSTAPLSVEVANRDDSNDVFELVVEGLDPSWTAIPVPSFQVDGRDVKTEKLFLKPPRESESTAGTYPFVVKLRSLNSGETQSAQGVLEIKPFHHLSVNVAPKKGIVKPFDKQAAFDVTVMNLGNSEHNLQLFATDTDDACAFEFEDEKLVVGPGQQKTVAMVAAGTRRALLANSRLFGFVVTARSVSAPTVMGSAQGQLEQRALASPGSMIVFILLALLLSAWVYSMPRAPKFEAFSVVPTEAQLGTMVQIKWTAPGATSVVLSVDRKEVQTFAGPDGEYSFVPTEARMYEIGAVARSGGKQSAPSTRMLRVDEPLPTPEPRILEFKITPATANVGDKLIVQYRLSPAVTKATLTPIGKELDPNIGQVEIDATREGEITYILVAENAKGQKVEKSQKVKVVMGSKAKIVLYKIEPKVVQLPDDRVTITWQLTDAVRAEIAYGSEPVVVDPAEGVLEVQIRQPSTIVLTAYDADGRTVKKELRVEVKDPPPQKEPDAPIEPTEAPN